MLFVCTVDVVGPVVVRLDADAVVAGTVVVGTSLRPDLSLVVRPVRAPAAAFLGLLCRRVRDGHVCFVVLLAGACEQSTLCTLWLREQSG